MAIRIPVKVHPNESDVKKVREIVNRYVDKRWRPYMLFKGEVMIEQGYSVSEIERQFSSDKRQIS